MTDTADKPIPADLPARAPSSVSPAVVASYRSQLTRGEDVVDHHTWAGSVPAATGIAPRVRIGRSRWFNLLWLLPIGFVVLIVAVAAAKGLRGMPSVQRFIERYPGTTPTGGLGPIRTLRPRTAVPAEGGRGTVGRQGAANGTAPAASPADCPLAPDRRPAGTA